jgi:hypothetical protein
VSNGCLLGSLANVSNLNHLTLSYSVLKVPKIEIFANKLYTLSNPIWVVFFTDDLECCINYSTPTEYAVKIIPGLLSGH